MADDWITTKEAAQISGYHPERIRELVREGKIMARKWGPAFQISNRSLKEYLESAVKTEDKRFGPKKKGSNR